ncbi:potassium sodium hyperpolarization-activated cyclic nucleotide-gated channel [Aureococcus anophagefferens]|nr:potassium sodium hyperpolarization-activated cyclic nucleotide-gated channel [Aureococcus anophagefferens]
MAPDGDDEAKVPLAVELAPAQADGDRSPARGGSSSPGRGSPSRYVGGLSAVSEEEPRDEDAEIATFLKKQASRLHGMQSPRHSKERGSPILSPDEIEMHLHGAVSGSCAWSPRAARRRPRPGLLPGFNVWTFKFLFDLIIDGFFIADIYVAFKTGFIEDGVVVMDAARIRARYLRSGFAADLVATLPLDVVQAFAAAATNDNSSGDNQSLVYSATRIGRIARLSRLLRLARVARFFRYSHFYLSGLHEGHVRILALGFSILLFAHWDACLLYLSARLKDFDADRTWVGFLGLQHRPKSVQYLYAVFKAYSHMLCIGYGVAMPLSTVEVVLTTLSMLLGAALFAGIIGSLTAFMMSLDSPSAKRGSARGQSHSVLDEDQILGQLSPQLRREVNLYLVSRLVESSPLLNGTLVRGAIAIAVVPLLRPLKVLEAETIINRDEPPAGFYFIDAGAVQLYRDEAHVASMEAGSYFGEIPLIFDGVALQPFTAAALEPCELWTISTADFGRLAALFPELKKIMAEAEGSEAALRREDHAVRLLEGLFSSPDVRDIAVRMLVTNAERARASTSPAPPAAGLLDQGGVLPAQAETSP